MQVGIYICMFVCLFVCLLVCRYVCMEGGDTMGGGRWAWWTGSYICIYLCIYIYCIHVYKCISNTMIFVCVCEWKMAVSTKG